MKYHVCVTVKISHCIACPVCWSLLYSFELHWFLFLVCFFPVCFSAVDFVEYSPTFYRSLTILCYIISFCL